MKEKFAVADAHCDTATRLMPLELALGCEKGHLDLPRLPQARVKLQFMAFFLGRQPPQAAWQQLRHGLTDLRLAMQLAPVGVELLLDLGQAGLGWRPQLLLAVEGLDLLAADWRQAEQLYALGLRSLGLFWNNDNFLGCGADAVGERDQGLTAIGRDFVAYAEERGFLVDLAHASRNSFWQAAGICAKPLFVSHACCDALCPHRRNLTDEQLRAIGESGGLVGITLAPAFLRQQPGQAGLADVVRHLRHAVKLAGWSAVGLGSDFDGVEELPQGIAGVQSWPRLAEALLAEGLTEAEVERLLSGNLLAFLRRYGC